jgi:hypothetical protein
MIDRGIKPTASLAALIAISGLTAPHRGWCRSIDTASDDAPKRSLLSSSGKEPSKLKKNCPDGRLVRLATSSGQEAATKIASNAHESDDDENSDEDDKDDDDAPAAEASEASKPETSDKGPAAASKEARADRAPDGSATTGKRETNANVGSVSKDDDENEKEDDDAAEDLVFAGEAQFDFNSRLVWRGIALTRGAVWEPSASVFLYGFTAEYWSSYALTREFQNNYLVAIVPSISYEWRWRQLSIQPGVTLYDMPHEGNLRTVETALEASYRLGPVKAFSQNTLDVRSYKGAYFGFAGLDYERRGQSGLQFHAVAEWGYANAKFNQSYLNIARAALNMAAVSASLRFNLTDYFYVLLHSEFTTLLTFRQQVAEPTLINGGSAVGLEF